LTDKGTIATAFFEAIRKGNDVAVDAAIGAHAELLQARDDAGLSPVLAAAYAGHAKMAARLAALAAKAPDGLDIFGAAAVLPSTTTVRTDTRPCISRPTSDSSKWRGCFLGAAPIRTPWLSTNPASRRSIAPSPPNTATRRVC
jgi:ankyrin repeat protein